MSINKVLNRPMFRKEALRQGVLKPIKARVGRYIQQGPLMQQGPGVAPGPYSRVPLTQQGPIPKSFSYNPRTGDYITDYGKKAIPRNIPMMTNVLIRVLIDDIIILSFFMQKNTSFETSNTII